MQPHIEQIEVIERHITEGRRPREPGSSYLPSTTIQTYSETFDVPRNELLLNRRYDLTGERDVSRDASFVHSSANYGNQLDEFPTERRFSPINNYGYDVHEVHTSEGGARIVETHGGGLMDTSHSRLESTRIDEQSPASRPGISSVLRSGLRATPPGILRHNDSAPIATSESWKELSAHDDSFTRKDSYRKMQSSQDSKDTGMHTLVERSQTSLVSKGAREDGSSRGSNRGCFARTKLFVLDVMDALREAEMTPSLLAHLCCILLLLLLLLALVIIVLSALFNRYSVREFLLFPPVCEECRRKNPHMLSAQLPSSVFVHYYSANQAHFELRGNQPFKSNSFTAIDFTTGQIAIADHALTDSNGRHTTCFILPLDRTAIPSLDALMDALDESDYEIQAQFGWQEFWQFEPEPIDALVARSKFSEEIRDCSSAKWLLLRQTVTPRDSSCSDCYDFCLPDWAVVRKVKYEDESTLGVRRLNCFRLFVPEWRDISIKPDPWGGHWQYPLVSHSTRRDSNGEWVSWAPVSNSAA